MQGCQKLRVCVYAHTHVHTHVCVCVSVCVHLMYIDTWSTPDLKEDERENNDKPDSVIDDTLNGCKTWRRAILLTLISTHINSHTRRDAHCAMPTCVSTIVIHTSVSAPLS